MQAQSMPRTGGLPLNDCVTVKILQLIGQGLPL